MVDTRTLGRGTLLALLGFAFTGGAVRAQAQAQAPATVNTTQATRAELQQLLAQYTKTADSKGYSAAFRERARTEAELIRTRLTEGDLQVGDRIQLVVEGQKQLTDTFTVTTGRNLVLPMTGTIPMSGVLRSEVGSYLTEQIGRYVRDPVVHARSLLRVSVTGAVGHPGYYVVPSEALVTDVLMAAGGPNQNAAIDHIRIERDNRTIWDATLLQQMITEGRTLDQLSLRAGDRIVVPVKSSSGWTTARDVLVFASPIVVLVTYLFRH